jgi:hypothetical protein
MINKKLNIIYIHIPKTGGTTIGNIFHPDTEIIDKPINALGKTYSDILSDPILHIAEHKSYNQYKDILQEINFNIQYFYIFTFTRNPYARVYSSWKFLCYQVNINNQVFNFIDPKIISSFEAFVHHLFYNNHRDFCIEQVNYAISSNCNFIGRYESFESDLSILMKKFNIERTIPHLNKTSSNMNEYKQHYTKSMQNMIYKIYESDFIEFNYDYFIN